MEQLRMTKEIKKRQVSPKYQMTGDLKNFFFRFLKQNFLILMIHS